MGSIAIGGLPIGKVHCVAPAGDRCGEGAVWHPSEKAVYWTDINRFLIHRYDEETDAVNSWFFDEPVVALALTERDDTLLVALASRLILWEPQTDVRRDHGFTLNGWPKVRLNDGRADPLGNFWVGSMRNNVNPDGSPGAAGGTDGVLYRIDSANTHTVFRRDLGIANTLCWSPDLTRFYHADTLANTICVWDYDAKTGAISNERPFFAGFERGYPDGSAIDSEGYLWNCRFGGQCIVRIAPDGTIDRIIEMPAQNITTAVFGGNDLKTLYATSAGAETHAGDRLAGSLFALRTQTPGLAPYRVRL
ncbi:SMP-30/gluconolactonase/LRE family protein [Pseudochelatococcus sp. G4_1912]|uniref:SMP-30/gluconolactonase/LRE family protein n=1 Tax=Pseudochelatococcus sp. G4_1912 TaxID=3114288 RepID=UPI0039C69A6D